MKTDSASFQSADSLFPKDRSGVIEWLQSRGDALEALYRRADAVRHARMGDEIPLRGIIEFSNACANDCLYCGIRRSNSKVRRYTLDEKEIVDLARQMEAWQQTTVVLQSGEAETYGDQALGELIRRIKTETHLAVTLSVGNRSREVYAYWRDCGLDRFLLRFETSDPALYARLHPDGSLKDRLDCLQALRSLGIQTGSGFMIGLPGETIEILAQNILLCRELDFDMIGIGPFIAHPDTPLGGESNAYANDPDMFFRTMAVLRLANPQAHLPATTAYDALFPNSGRNLALQRGANVFMPNNTPARYRKDYLLYPGKPCDDETSEQRASHVFLRLRSLGRPPGVGPGHSHRSQTASAT